MHKHTQLFLNSLPIIFTALVLSSCSTPEHVELKPVEYQDIPHFQTDPIEKALPALASSCKAVLKNPSKSYYSPDGNRSMSDYIPFCRCIVQ
ncbi:MAG: hypothetical protein Q8K36_01000, partial [Alphaproteobacteria bacterium]|nr:hypothetical protein [Alphaproteobacteria bacterium]